MAWYGAYALSYPSLEVSSCIWWLASVALCPPQSTLQRLDSNKETILWTYENVIWVIVVPGARRIIYLGVAFLYRTYELEDLENSLASFPVGITLKVTLSIDNNGCYPRFLKHLSG